MTVDEATAKTKWCLMSQVSAPGGDFGSSRENLANGHKCIASECMKWEWENDIIRQKGCCGKD